jgi:hypothetical protein
VLLAQERAGRLSLRSGTEGAYSQSHRHSRKLGNRPQLYTICRLNFKTETHQACPGSVGRKQMRGTPARGLP